MEDRDKIIDYTKPIRFPDDCSKVRKNFTQGYFYREIGRYKNVIPSEFQWAAEDKLINKNTFEELKCQLPDSPRSTFLMVFSPDGKKVASTHGNHNVYVTDLTTGKNIQTLSGHPRTPWCIAFHPSSNQILASGCLGGQVRVWDLHGGSEVWTAESQTVIASLAFHPVDRMLVIATYNELHFWDWSQPEPFAKCSTKTEREKVRYVSFDRLGNKLITGIANPVNVPSQWDRINVVNSQSPSTSTTATTSFSSTPSTTVASTQASTDQGRSITFCYRHLMNQYNQLVNRYFDLSRSRITPTIDRGTDPMDLLDLRNSGSTSESALSNPSPSTSNSQTSASSPLRFKITRSASRTYRPLSSRERFRIHSSIFSRLNNRSSLPSNPFTFCTTPNTLSNQHSTFTTPLSLGSPSTSSSQSTPRLRRYSFSLGPTARSLCLTFTPESSSNLFFTRNTSQAASSSRAVTNPTYTSYSDRGIFSTRETSSNNSGSQLSLFWPYRVLFDDADDHRLTIHRTAQHENGENSSNRSSSETGTNALNNESLIPVSRCNSTTTVSARSLHDTVLHSSDETERESQRSSSGFHLRRQRNDLTNLSRSTAEEPTSHNEFPHPSRPSSAFQLTPVDLRNVNEGGRSRESDSFERRFSAGSQLQSLPQSPMHPRPVARFQVRSRLLQEHQSQLHLITNRETHGLNLQNNQNLRRQLSFRPEGQFVLSRHSNSPFQPRVPHQINNSSQNISPTLLKNTSGSRPLIPSLRSSFTSSLSSNLNSTEAASTSSEGNNSFSPSSVASNLSFMGESSSRQLREQIKTRLFDRVEMMLRDRMRNSSEIPSIDSTVNYSQISGESEADVNSLESEDINLSRGLGPRGTDPMLSSASENRDTSNEDLFLHESSSTLSQTSNNASLSGNGFGVTQNESEMLNLWESESETVPLSLNSNLPLNDLFNEQSQPNRETASDRNSTGLCQNTETEITSRPNTNLNSSSAEFNMRQGIQRLSLHIENMQRLCWARIEILQRQKIRGMWENLTNQIKQFQNAIQTRTERDSLFSNQNDNSSSGSGIPSFRDLAISSSSATETNSSAPSTSSNYNNVLNGCKELVESMVNELFNGTKNSKDSNKGESSLSDSNSQTSYENSQKNNSVASEIAGTSSKNEMEEPQPGPSGLSLPNTSRGVKNLQPKNENLTFRLYKHFIETLQRERRRRDIRPGGMSTSSGLSRQNHFRLRNSSRARFRNHRHGRHIFDFFASRSRTINRELEALLKSRRKERITSRTHQSLSTSSAAQQPSTSTARSPGSSDACQSCGQKKKPSRECNRQKRRSTDSLCGSGTTSVASKVLKNNTGERSRVPSEESRDEGAEPSTSTQESSFSQGQDKSTNELLKQMIQTMETMLRFLREAFCKTEELAGSQSLRQRSTVLSSSDSDDSDSNDLNNSAEQFSRNLPRNFRCTKEIITNLMRDVTQLHAKKLSRFMIKSLTQFFGKNFGSLIQVLDEQIFSLYMLLHLALELTDLLLDQLDARSRDLERTWAVDNSPAINSESRARNFFLSRSSDASGRRPRYRNITRSSYSQSFSTSAEDNLRRKMSINPLMASNSRLGTSRINPASSSTGTNHDVCGTYLSNYVTSKMRTARMSTSLPSGWCRRGSRTPIHSSSSLNGNSTRNLRSFRFDRRTNEENESQSGERVFDYGGINDNNNNNNHSIQTSNINMNNSNNNDSNDNNDNNNSDMGNDTNNNYNLNDSRSNSSNNNGGYYDSNTNTSNDANRNSGPINNNNNNTNNSNNSNFFNHYFPNSSSSNSDSSNNNIIIVTGLNSESDVINSSGNSINNSRSISSEANLSRPSGSNSFLSQNPLTPLRSMELTLSRNESGDLSLRDERPIFWIRYGGNSETSSSPNNNDSQSRVSTFTVPVVQVNDVPVSDVSMLNQPRHRPQSPVPRVPEDVWRWRAWRPRLLHPRYSGPNPFEDQDSNDVPENIHYYRILSTSAGSHLGVYTLDPMIITDAPLSPRHRIQAWDFSKMNIPDISDREANGVVPECKIHNDASVDVSNDGHLLVTLLPSGRLSNTTMLGVYSLDWSSLGQLLYRTSFEQNAVSVSLSPTNRHLLVGLASRPVVVRDRTNMAQIFRLEGGRPSPNGGSWQSGRGRLVHMRDLEQTRETNIMSLNCIRWAPGAGQGLVYGTNTGQLKVLR